MSLSEFSVELRPESGLRLLVMLSAIAAAVLGLVLILQLPLGLVWCCLLAVFWVGHCGQEMRVLAQARRRVTRIRIDNRGGAQAIDLAGQAETVLLLPGSLVLSRVAWLRIGFDDGIRYAELLRGNSVKDPEWHRFQLVWQQTRQTVGCADRS